jgi:hypothetical protein
MKRWRTQPDGVSPSRHDAAKVQQGLGRDTVQDAAALLGEQHPLARALDLLDVASRQSLVVAGVIVMSAVGIASHVRYAVSVLVGAAVVEFALGAVLALLVEQTRERARDLIIQGREDLPLQAVASERERLLNPHVRRGLARALERVLRAAEDYERLTISSRPPPGTRCLRAVAPELREIAAGLRAEEVGVRAVARVARLLTGGYASPVYTGRLGEVRLELERIRAELPSDPQASGGAVARYERDGRRP